MCAQQIKALHSEQKVLTDLIKKGHRLIYHRKKLFGVEVDLLLHDQDGIIQIVEVKSYTSVNMLPHRLTIKQKNRLIFAKRNLEAHFKLPTQVILSLVSGQDVDHIIVG